MTWKNESHRHKLSAMGISTSRIFQNDMKKIVNYGRDNIIRVKLRPTPEALEFVKKALEKHPDFTDITFKTRTGAVFQSAWSYKEQYWYENRLPLEIIESAIKQPDMEVKFSLIGNCKRWYSTGRIGSIIIEIETKSDVL